MILKQFGLSKWSVDIVFFALWSRNYSDSAVNKNFTRHHTAVRASVISWIEQNWKHELSVRCHWFLWKEWKVIANLSIYSKHCLKHMFLSMNGFSVIFCVRISVVIFVVVAIYHVLSASVYASLSTTKQQTPRIFDLNKQKHLIFFSPASVWWTITLFPLLNFTVSVCFISLNGINIRVWERKVFLPSIHSGSGLVPYADSPADRAVPELWKGDGWSVPTNKAP